MTTLTRCEVAGCRAAPELWFYRKGLCAAHYDAAVRGKLKITLPRLADGTAKFGRWEERPGVQFPNTKPQGEESMSIKKTVKKSSSKRLMGKSSGVGYHATWVKVLEDSAKKKLTDDQIKDVMAKEFPGKSMCTPGVARGNYNRGVFHKENGKLHPPKTQLVRHGAALSRGRAAKKVVKPTAAPAKKVAVVVKKKPATVAS